jgi:hypothetical protein
VAAVEVGDITDMVAVVVEAVTEVVTVVLVSLQN